MNSFILERKMTIESDTLLNELFNFLNAELNQSKILLSTQRGILNESLKIVQNMISITNNYEENVKTLNEQLKSLISSTIINSNKKSLNYRKSASALVNLNILASVATDLVAQPSPFESEISDDYSSEIVPQGIKKKMKTC